MDAVSFPARFTLLPLQAEGCPKGLISPGPSLPAVIEVFLQPRRPGYAFQTDRRQEVREVGEPPFRSPGLSFCAGVQVRMEHSSTATEGQKEPGKVDWLSPPGPAPGFPTTHSSGSGTSRVQGSSLGQRHNRLRSGCSQISRKHSEGTLCSVAFSEIDSNFRNYGTVSWKSSM